MNTKREIRKVYLMKNIYGHTLDDLEILNVDDLEILADTDFNLLECKLKSDKNEYFFTWNASIIQTSEFPSILNGNILLFYTQNIEILLFEISDKNNLTISNNNIIFDNLRSIDTLYIPTLEKYIIFTKTILSNSAVYSYLINLIKQYKRDKIINNIISF
jgi:hypothetical protein